MYRMIIPLILLLVFTIMVSCGGKMAYALEAGEAKITEEELTPTEVPLVVKYVPIAPAPKKVTVESLQDVFAEASPLNVPLQKQDRAIPNGGGSIDSVSVRGLHDGKFIYLLLEWTDPTQDSSAMAHELYRDAVGIMYPLGKWSIDPSHPFSPRMGDRGKPVNIWHWKADWERDLKAFVDIEDQYPNMWNNYFTDPYHLAIRDDLYNSVPFVAGGRAAGNLFSLPNRGTSVEDLNAEGFYTLTAQEHQDVVGHGIWKDGRWHVLITRRLTTPDHFDAQFVPGDQTYFNVAVWNGSAHEVDGEKNVSTRWHPIQLEAVPYTTIKPGS